MSTKPKLLRIVDAVADRISVITADGSYTTSIGCNIRRSRIAPSLNDCPCALVYLDARTSSKTNGYGKSVATCTLVVEGYVPASNDQERAGIEVLSDIQRAVESDDDLSLSGLLAHSNGGLAWAGDEILYPESGEPVAGARVEYLIPHIRLFGDPESI